MLEVKGLTKRYSNLTAVDDVSFNVKDNTRVLMLGPNGAGKTTIIKCIMNFIKFEGEITFSGIDVRKDGSKVRSLIGFVPQHPAFYDNLTVREHLKLIANLKGIGRDDGKANLEAVGLWDARDKPVRALSHGMKQRFAIGLAMLGDPPFLIFDEPTTNVDINGQLEFEGKIQEFAQGRKTVLVVTHLAGISEFVDEVIVMAAGKVIAQGKPEILLNRMNAKDILYLKFSDRLIGDVTHLLKGLGYLDVTTKMDWVMVKTSPKQKAAMLKAVIDRGYEVQDIVVEPAEIESAYLGLVSESSS